MVYPSRSASDILKRDGPTILPSVRFYPFSVRTSAEIEPPIDCAGFPSAAMCMWGSGLANAAIFALVLPSVCTSICLLNILLNCLSRPSPSCCLHRSISSWRCTRSLIRQIHTTRFPRRTGPTPFGTLRPSCLSACRCLLLCCGSTTRSCACSAWAEGGAVNTPLVRARRAAKGVEGGSVTARSRAWKKGAGRRLGLGPVHPRDRLSVVLE